ncbi:MAG: ABC transporter permease subunit [Roseburia sp.]|nr:ABC transporter permease subunit [Anaeroplasma bactoclasticum]MCM1196532.1 ABC transporter permease subunit [Roseburia sp.]MCM1557110.1 ABC transporter permease subunit [Anaeroplasma bactoclasticum]
MSNDVLELDSAPNLKQENTQDDYTDLSMMPKASKWDKWKANFKKRGWILLFIIPALVYIIIFCYAPMYGILVAFQDYIPGDNIIGSDTKWVGFENFHTFFANPNFGKYFLNTFLLCILGFIVGFPLPIIVSLLLNSLTKKKAKKGFQILYYAPHFISLVVLVGMMKLIFGSDGLLDQISIKLGGDVNGLQLFLNESAFRPLFIFSGNWQDFGWSAIIYLAALAGVDPTLHEAAKVDGASRFRRIFSVDLPAIAPTIVMLMILSVGNLMSCGYEKVLLMQTGGNIGTSEILSTYVYTYGLLGGQYGVGTAAGLFNSVINVALLIIANTISKKLSNHSMW